MYLPGELGDGVLADVSNTEVAFDFEDRSAHFARRTAIACRSTVASGMSVTLLCVDR